MKVLPFVVAAAAVLLSACASTSNPADGANAGNAAIVSGNSGSSTGSAGNSSLNPAQPLPQVDAARCRSSSVRGCKWQERVF